MDTLVSHCITWLHEVVYTAAGQPVVYNKISLVLFVKGYII